MPSSCAARTTARTDSMPARWPSMRSRPRCFAQRPLPSMMTATWRGMGSARMGRSCIVGSPLDLEDLLLLLVGLAVDLLHEVVGEVLDALLGAMAVVAP